MLEGFFTPSSIAVVGASRTPGKVGYDILKNLIDAGFAGPIYPINPKTDEVLGRKCYPGLSSVGEPIGLAIVVIPAWLVLDAVDQCAQVGVGAVIVISAGFKESGPEGAELEEELARRCARSNIRCVGPNCLGIINPHHHLNASFGAAMPSAGNVAFFSQSGALGTYILDVCAGEGLGISRFVSYGNKADVDESDLVEALGGDDTTGVILGYVESIDDGAKFMEVARRVTKKKPVIILKSGRTAAGARAASSHTGSLAGSDAAYSAAFVQCGVIRAQSVTEFFDLAFAFSSQKPPRGNAVAVVTNAGGPGIIATDAIESTSLTMAELSEATRSRLASQLPPAASTGNPIDVLGDAKAGPYRVALREALADEGVDAVLTILTPQTSTEPEATAEVLGRAAAATDKPVLAAFMGSLSVRKGRRVLEEMRVPNYAHPERAIKTLHAMHLYHRWTRAEAEGPPRLELDDAMLKRIFTDATSAGVESLGELHARRVLQACGMVCPDSVFAASEDEAVKAARDIGLPVVMKVSSADILHKSDAGGVKMALSSEEGVRAGYREIMAGARAYDPDAEVDGVLVQQMVTGGTEVIVGLSRDPQFGPLIMFGLGGIYVEVLKDVSFRVAPMGETDAREMIEEVRSAKVLQGVRGQQRSDVDALVDCILRISQLAAAYPVVAECDINPLKVMAAGQGVVALDARLRLEQRAAPGL